MRVTITGKSGNKYNFEGPYSNTGSLEDRSGVYVILCEKNGELYLIDVGESSEVKRRVDTHDRKECWEKNCSGTLEYAVYYIEHGKKSSRVEIEQDIRDNYDIPCGKR